MDLSPLDLRLPRGAKINLEFYKGGGGTPRH